MEHPLCARGWTHLVSFNCCENLQGKDEKGRLKGGAGEGQSWDPLVLGNPCSLPPSGEKRKVSVPGLRGTWRLASPSSPSSEQRWDVLAAIS